MTALTIDSRDSRVTPSRLASRSNGSNIHSGKSMDTAFFRLMEYKKWGAGWLTDKSFPPHP